MSFEVDRYSSAWAHIALCADLTWAKEPPDEFTIANQRLWAQHCRVSQVLQDSSTESQQQSSNQCEAERLSTSSQSQENNNRKSVKDVIPESRLAQFYGNFYYDEAREKSYANAHETSSWRGYNGQGCENCDLTECWMLPEVEYWFRKLLDDAPERAGARRRRCRVPNDELDEACLLTVRGIWRARSPPPAPRKLHTRRPRRLHKPACLPKLLCDPVCKVTRTSTLGLDHPDYQITQKPAPRKLHARCPRRLHKPVCLPKLLCDPVCKFHLEAPQPPLQCQRARLATGVQVAVRTYRASVSRYAPTVMRPRVERRGIGWREHPPTLDSLQLRPIEAKNAREDKKPEAKPEKQEEESRTDQHSEKPVSTKEKVIVDDQQPTTSAAMDLGRKKRLYSTVLSMSAPINLPPVRLAQNLAPALLKLNPKIVLPAARIRPAVEKFEELEKEALEQYKASDESIDTKFRELEKQAVDQYSASNSNTSCSSGQSAEKPVTSPTIPESTLDRAAKFPTEKTDNVVYTQNFPGLHSKGQTASITNLKNFRTPPRGDKRETHRPKLRDLRDQRAASDTEGKTHNSPRSHVVPKKRHLTLCVSDFSSDEMEDAGTIKDAGPIKKHLGKMLSAHGGGDLIMRKT